MADIKTRDTVKGTIKTLDKAAVAGQKMKQACKFKTEYGNYRCIWYSGCYDC